MAYGRIAWLSLCAVVFASGAMAEELREIPDPALTPGQAETTDPNEVCGFVGGLSYSERHRLSQNEAVKRQVLARYGVPWEDRARYEDDHYLPLCAAGSDAIANRWPQPRFGRWTAADKDRLEAAGCRLACSGQVPLATVQAWFLAPADWRVSFCLLYPSDQRCPP